MNQRDEVVCDCLHTALMLERSVAAAQDATPASV
jgi:hypothetical protein